MASLLGCSSDVCAVVSKLSGVHVKTVRRLHAKLEAVLWEPREVRVGKRHAAQTLRRPEQDKRRQLPSPRLASATAARVTETKSEPGRLNVSASAGDSTNSSSNNKTTNNNNSNNNNNNNNNNDNINLNACGTCADTLESIY